MAKEHLQLKPHNIDERAWWYEERAGVCVVVECRDKAGNWIETKQAVIPWRSIRAAMRRKDKEASDGEEGR